MTFASKIFILTAALPLAAACDDVSECAAIENVPNYVFVQLKVGKASLSESELTEADYLEVADMRSDFHMSHFIEDFLEQNGKMVTDHGELMGFTEWYSGTKATQTLARMAEELATKPWVAPKPKAAAVVSQESKREGPISEQDYQEVAALQSNAAMASFIVRVLLANHKEVTDYGELMGFAEWYSGTKATQSLARMMEELANKPWVVRQTKPMNLAQQDATSSASFTEKDYQRVANLISDTEMARFARAVLASEGKVVTNNGELMGLIQWFSGTKATQSLAQMKSELMTKPWVVKKGNSATEQVTNTPQFTEERYQQVAALKNDDAMMKFIETMLSGEGKMVTDRGELAGFAQWYSGVKATQTLALLKQELAAKPWVASKPEPMALVDNKQSADSVGKDSAPKTPSTNQKSDKSHKLFEEITVPDVAVADTQELFTEMLHDEQKSGAQTKSKRSPSAPVASVHTASEPQLFRTAAPQASNGKHNTSAPSENSSNLAVEHKRSLFAPSTNKSIAAAKHQESVPFVNKSPVPQEHRTSALLVNESSVSASSDAAKEIRESNMSALADPEVLEVQHQKSVTSVSDKKAVSHNAAMKRMRELKNTSLRSIESLNVAIVKMQELLAASLVDPEVMADVELNTSLRLVNETNVAAPTALINNTSQSNSNPSTVETLINRPKKSAQFGNTSNASGLNGTIVQPRALNTSNLAGSEMMEVQPRNIVPFAHKFNVSAAGGAFSNSNVSALRDAINADNDLNTSSSAGSKMLETVPQNIGLIDDESNADVQTRAIKMPQKLNSSSMLDSSMLVMMPKDVIPFANKTNASVQTKPIEMPKRLNTSSLMDSEMLEVMPESVIPFANNTHASVQTKAIEMPKRLNTSSLMDSEILEVMPENGIPFANKTNASVQIKAIEMPKQLNTSSFVDSEMLRIVHKSVPSVNQTSASDAAEAMSRMSELLTYSLIDPDVVEVEKNESAALASPMDLVNKSQGLNTSGLASPAMLMGKAHFDAELIRRSEFADPGEITKETRSLSMSTSASPEVLKGEQENSAQFVNNRNVTELVGVNTSTSANLDMPSGEKNVKPQTFSKNVDGETDAMAKWRKLLAARANSEMPWVAQKRSVKPERKHRVYHPAVFVSRTDEPETSLESSAEKQNVEHNMSVLLVNDSSFAAPSAVKADQNKSVQLLVNKSNVDIPYVNISSSGAANTSVANRAEILVNDHSMSVPLIVNTTNFSDRYLAKEKQNGLSISRAASMNTAKGEHGQKNHRAIKRDDATQYVVPKQARETVSKLLKSAQVTKPMRKQQQNRSVELHLDNGTAAVTDKEASVDRLADMAEFSASKHSKKLSTLVRKPVVVMNSLLKIDGAERNRLLKVYNKTGVVAQLPDGIAKQFSTSQVEELLSFASELQTMKLKQVREVVKAYGVECDVCSVKTLIQKAMVAYDQSHTQYNPLKHGAKSKAEPKSSDDEADRLKKTAQKQGGVHGTNKKAELMSVNNTVRPRRTEAERAEIEAAQAAFDAEKPSESIEKRAVETASVENNKEKERVLKETEATDSKTHEESTKTAFVDENEEENEEESEEENEVQEKKDEKQEKEEKAEKEEKGEKEEEETDAAEEAEQAEAETFALDDVVSQYVNEKAKAALVTVGSIVTAHKGNDLRSQPRTSWK